MSEAIPATQATSVTADRLRALLADFGGSPGRALPAERDLSARLGVGRRAVRQALAELAAEGRVWRRQGKGTFPGPAPAAVPPTLPRMAARTTFAEVMEVRATVEPALAALAAARAAPAQAALIRHLAGRTTGQGAGTPARDLEDCDGALHRAVAEAAGNHLFLDLFAMVDRIRHDPAWRGARAAVRTPERLARSAAEHLAIADAIGRRDADGAAEIMRAHIDALRDALSEGPADG